MKGSVGADPAFNRSAACIDRFSFAGLNITLMSCLAQSTVNKLDSFISMREKGKMDLES